jgi:hypothetical protein
MLRILCGSGLVLAMLLLGEAGAGDRKDAKNERVTRATITRIDATRNTITLKWRDKNGKEMERTLELTNGPKIFDEKGKAVQVNVFSEGGNLYVVEREEKVYELRKTEKRPANAPSRGAASQAPGQAKGIADNTHTGKVVSVTGNKLVMRGEDKDGKEGREHSHTLARNAKVTCDGKQCVLSDLKPGMRVRVTTMPSDPTMAVRIEALDKNRTFEKAGATP